MSLQSDYIEYIGPIIKKYAKKYGYKYPSAIIGQACVESAYGASLLSSKYHNHFGMKCGSSWTGRSVNLSTLDEYQAGTLVRVNQYFRVYDNDEEGVKGYFEFIQYPRYSNLKATTSSRDYLQTIQNDGYAWSGYTNQVYKVVEMYNLLRFDDESVTVTEEHVAGQKSLSEIAAEVMAGKWGNGNARKSALTKAGYNYAEVQAEVNRLVSGGSSTKTSKKSVTTIAKEVIAGKWGNGAARKQALQQAGYDYTAVQKKVNELLGKG